MGASPATAIARLCTRCGLDTSESEASAACPSCGGETRDVRRDGEPGPGRLIGGKYILVRWLGRGGFGSVFAARDPLLEREVAVKVLHVDFESKPQTLKRFYAEARNTSKLSHPHNVKVFDFGHTDDGLVYIVMELLDGRPLSKTERPMDPPRAARILDQAARALADAHGLGLIHRDLKPDNVMVTTVDGKDFVKVLDYGISKLEDSSVGLTGEGGFVGTPAFTSPEQVRGRPADRRSDIYCFGLLAYDLLTGHAPFEAEDPIAVAMMQIHDTPPRLGTQVAGVSPELEYVVTRCIQKDPAKRYPDMKAVSAALELTPEFGRPDVHSTPTRDRGIGLPTPTVTVNGDTAVSADQWPDVMSDTVAVVTDSADLVDITLTPLEDTEAAESVGARAGGGTVLAPEGLLDPMSGATVDEPGRARRTGITFALLAAAAVAIGVVAGLAATADRTSAPQDPADSAALVEAEPSESPEAATEAGIGDEGAEILAEGTGTGADEGSGDRAAAAEAAAAAQLQAAGTDAQLDAARAGLAVFRAATAAAGRIADARRAEVERIEAERTASRRSGRSHSDRAEAAPEPTADPRDEIRDLLGGGSSGDSESGQVRDEIRDLLRDP